MFYINITHFHHTLNQENPLCRSNELWCIQHRTSPNSPNVFYTQEIKASQTSHLQEFFFSSIHVSPLTVVV